MRKYILALLAALALVVLAYRINHSDTVPLTPPRVLPNLNGVSFR
jgi:hypothetical protein